MRASRPPFPDQDREGGSGGVPSLPQEGAGQQRGNALIEMALVVQVLVLLLAGVLEVGRVLEVWVVTTNAAREGARLAALGRPIGEVQERTATYLATSLAGRTDVVLPDTTDVTVTNAGGMPGDPVTVEVRTGVLLMTPLLQSVFPANPVSVRAALTMRLQ